MSDEYSSHSDDENLRVYDNSDSEEEGDNYYWQPSPPQERVIRTEKYYKVGAAAFTINYKS